MTRRIALSRANAAQSRRLCEQSRVLITRYARICSGILRGASDDGASDYVEERPREASAGQAASNGHPGQGAESPSRRTVLVLARDAVMRGFIADAIRDQYEVVDAADVKSAVAAATNGLRVDLVVAGCFTLDEPGVLEACSAVARELYEHCPWIPVVLVADTPPPALAAELLLTGVRAFMRREFTPDEFAATAARVGRRPDAAVPTPTRVAAIKGTFAVLEQAITSVPALASLAARANMSRSHFSRTFHAVAGIPLRDYVRDLRLKHAQELMRGSRLSLTSIATASGFYDLPHFNKAFRHRFGMSPTQFRLASLSSSSPAA